MGVSFKDSHPPSMCLRTNPALHLPQLSRKNLSVPHMKDGSVSQEPRYPQATNPMNTALPSTGFSGPALPALCCHSHHCRTRKPSCHLARGQDMGMVSTANQLTLFYRWGLPINQRVTGKTCLGKPVIVHGGFVAAGQFSMWLLYDLLPR